MAEMTCDRCGDPIGVRGWQRLEFSSVVPRALCNDCIGEPWGGTIGSIERDVVMTFTTANAEAVAVAEARATAAEALAGEALRAYRLLVLALEDLDANLVRLSDETGEWVTMYQMGTGRWHHILGMVRGSDLLSRDDARRLLADAPRRAGEEEAVDG